jgi:tungstate transport system permease protein
MGYLTEGLRTALRLLATGDAETYSAVFTTIRISTLSIIASLLIGIPLGFLLGYYEFPGKKQVRTVVDTLLALPTVVVGLFVYAMISRRGPLGGLGLLFTIPGVAAAQTILVLPIVISLTATAIAQLDIRFNWTVQTLGANRGKTAATALYESRFAVLTAAMTAYGRAIGEVGVSMMIGGNIKWHTRTITTAIALETGKGQFATGIALGIVLLFLAFVVNWIVRIFRRRG